MEFINNYTDVILHSEAFLIVISGVVIYSAQQIISELWIIPNKNFWACRAKIETLMNRWDFLHKFTEGKSAMWIDADGTLEDKIIGFRKGLLEITNEFMLTYNALRVPEKFWIKKILRYKVKEAKVALLTLSSMVSKKSDYDSGVSKAASEIEKVYQYLKLSNYLSSSF